MGPIVLNVIIPFQWKGFISLTYLTKSLLCLTFVERRHPWTTFKGQIIACFNIFFSSFNKWFRCTLGYWETSTPLGLFSWSCNAQEDCHSPSCIFLRLQVDYKCILFILFCCFDFMMAYTLHIFFTKLLTGFHLHRLQQKSQKRMRLTISNGV